MSDPVAATVIIPTVGRVEQLALCLDSLAACDPRAAEILVTVQGDPEPTTRLVERFAHIGARVVACAGTGLGRNMNFGLRHARHEAVLTTDDDCTVATDWVGRGWAHLAARPDAIITGRVLATGNPAAVPSTITDPEPRDYTGQVRIGALYRGNMAVRRSLLLDAGGFDERIVPSAEDNDLCYRWLRARRPLRYMPDMVVWHHDWRDHEQLRRLYGRYGLGQGTFYAKHLRSGDAAIVGFMLRDLAGGLRLALRTLAHGRHLSSEIRLESLRQLPVGLVKAWPQFAATAEAAAADTTARTEIHARMPRVLNRWRTAAKVLGRRVSGRLTLLPPLQRVRRTRGRTPGARPLEPASRAFGWDRGEPIDRYYIRSFLVTHAADISGHVLEIGDDRYIRRFGRDLQRTDVLDIDSKNRRATIVADLADGDGLPSDCFDCMIVAQTLLLVFDLQAAVAQLHRALADGGVVLATLPGISQMCHTTHEQAQDFWRFTEASARRLFAVLFGNDNVTICAYGNLASACAFLEARAAEELSPAELDTRDRDYPVLIGVRAVKRASS
jgi:GT2 family glycosyltransferase/SAM-dependent methyltransferase